MRGEEGTKRTTDRLSSTPPRFGLNCALLISFALSFPRFGTIRLAEVELECHLFPPPRRARSPHPPPHQFLPPTCARRPLCSLFSAAPPASRLPHEDRERFGWSAPPRLCRGAGVSGPLCGQVLSKRDKLLRHKMAEAATKGRNRLCEQRRRDKPARSDSQRH